MDENKNSGGSFYAPNTTISSAATSPAHEFQSQNSNPRFLVNHTNDLNQNQLVSPSSLEAHDESIDPAINIFDLNQVPVAFCENSLEQKSSSQASRDSLEAHCNSSPKTSPCSLLPVQSTEPWDKSLNDEISRGESNIGSNTVGGKTRKPSTKRKHTEETGSHDVVHGETNAGGNGENSGQSKQHEQKLRAARTSKYRGVSRGDIHRYETFLWDNSDPQARPRTVYVGGFADEETAARVYDLAALKLLGVSTKINFPLSEYEKDLEEMKTMTKKEYLVKLRRQSKGFSKGVSIYRGVTRDPKYNKWQARLGKGKETEGIYLGSFVSEEEAAKAYDVAAVRVRGMKAFTNFNISEYDVKSILESAKIPIGKGASRVVKENSLEEILVIKKRKKSRKLPILNLKPNALSSYKANPAWQSSVEEENVQNQLNDDNVIGGEEIYFPVHSHQNRDEFQNPDELLEENLAQIANGEDSICKLLREFEDSSRLTSPENEKFTNPVLHENPSSSPINSYQNLSSSLLQANQDAFLNLSTGDGDGNAFEINGDLSYTIERGVLSNEVWEGYPTNENFGSEFFQEMSQIAPCENYLQLLCQQNQDSPCDDLKESHNHQNPHQNPDLEVNPNLVDGLTETDLRENPKSSNEGEISSGGIRNANSAMMETEKNCNNGGSNERRFSRKTEVEAIEGDVEDDDLNSFSSCLETELTEKNFSKVQ